jgi:ABC-type Fe3+-hydroxamate transport system substrate-binding protein
LAGNPAGGESCAQRIRDNLAALRREAERSTPLRVLYLIWPKPLMSIGAGTYVDDYLAQGGFVNVARELEGRYPRLDLTTVGALDPDLILLPSEPYHYGESDRTEWLAHRDLRAARAGRVVLVDGEHFSWYGSRMDAGFADMIRLRKAYQASQ